MGQASAQNESQALTHYLNANTLAKTGRHPEAIQEYWTAFRFSNDESQLQSMCRMALIGYKELPNVSALEEESVHQRIRQQVDDRLATIRNASNDSASYHQRLASEATALARRNAAGTTILYADRHGHSRSRTDRAAKQSIIADGKRKSNAISRESQSHATYAAAQTRSLAETEANLEAQMHMPTSSGGSQLIHQGTSLYVRNYSK